MAVDFLGRGWKFPVLTGKDHTFLTTAGEANVRDSIWIILATARGERVMRPDFGCGIHELVFAVNDSTTLSMVKREVRQALVMWEPRIDVIDVDVETKGQGELLLINIHYRIRTTNNFFNLVFPFYLSGSAAE